MLELKNHIELWIEKMDENILSVIKYNDIEGFCKFFSSAKKIKDFRTDKNENILHLIGKTPNHSFFKNAFNYLKQKDEKILTNLLLERDNNDRIPANKDFLTNGEKMAVHNAVYNSGATPTPMTNEEKERYKNYTFMKKETKKYRKKHQQSLTYSGAEFDGSIPFFDETNHNNTFTTKFAAYPTIRLMSDKSAFDYTSIDFLRVTNQPLAKEVADKLDFPEDYITAFKMLNKVGEAFKFEMHDKNYQYLFRHMAKNHDTIIINPSEKLYGLCTPKENDDVGYYSLISLYATCLNENNPDLKNINETGLTLIHEATHSADNSFSSSPLFKAYLAISAGREDENPIIKNLMKTNATNYKAENFAIECLAEINALVPDKSSDPLTNEIFKTFKSYVLGQIHEDENHIELIDEQMLMFKNKDTLVDTYNYGLIKQIKRKNDVDFATPDEKKAIEGAVTDFINDLKEINANIQQSEAKVFNREAEEKELSQIFNYIPSSDKISDTFTKTTAKINESKDEKDLNSLLKSSISEYYEKDASKENLFKIALITSALKTKAFPNDTGKRMDYSYTSVFDFYNLIKSDSKDGDLIRYAKKMTAVIEAKEKNKNLSSEASNIALNTTANPVKVQNILDEIINISKKSNAEITAEIAKKAVKGKDMNVYDTIYATKLFDVLEKKSNRKAKYAEIDSSRLDSSISKDAIILDADFEMALNDTLPKSIETKFVDNEKQKPDFKTIKNDAFTKIKNLFIRRVR